MLGRSRAVPHKHRLVCAAAGETKLTIETMTKADKSWGGIVNEFWEPRFVACGADVLTPLTLVDQHKEVRLQIVVRKGIPSSSCARNCDMVPSCIAKRASSICCNASVASRLQLYS